MLTEISIYYFFILKMCLHGRIFPSSSIQNLPMRSFLAQIYMTISTCRWRMNMLATSQSQPRLSSITNVALGGSANQIAAFKLRQNQVISYIICISYVTCSKIENNPTYLVYYRKVTSVDMWTLLSVTIQCLFPVLIKL
jgi:hypothetical protein